MTLAGLTARKDWQLRARSAGREPVMWGSIPPGSTKGKQSMSTETGWQVIVCVTVCAVVAVVAMVFEAAPDPGALCRRACEATGAVEQCTVDPVSRVIHVECSR